jgi:hypothetical protein
VHGTTSVEQGAPGSFQLPQGQPGQRYAIIKGLLFGFEGPSLLGSLTLWMLKNGFCKTTTSPALRSQPLWAYSSAG